MSQRAGLYNPPSVLNTTFIIFPHLKISTLLFLMRSKAVGSDVKDVSDFFLSVLFDLLHCKRFLIL